MESEEAFVQSHNVENAFGSVSFCSADDIKKNDFPSPFTLLTTKPAFHRKEFSEKFKYGKCHIRKKKSHTQKPWETFSYNLSLREKGEEEQTQSSSSSY